MQILRNKTKTKTKKADTKSRKKNIKHIKEEKRKRSIRQSNKYCGFYTTLFFNTLISHKILGNFFQKIIYVRAHITSDEYYLC